MCRVSDDLKKCKKCWKARSGQPLTDDNGDILRDSNGIPLFPEPTVEEQSKKNEGPIPEGDYTLHSGKAKKPADKGCWTRKRWNDYEKNRGLLDSRVVPRSAGPWGERFTRLTPGYGDKKPDTKRRSHFNVHGGRSEAGGEWGSAGCIDPMCGDDDFFDEVERDAKGEDVHVIVDYSGDSMPDGCEEPSDCDKPTDRTPSSTSRPDV
jgi:hypothetical protein